MSQRNPQREVWLPGILRVALLVVLVVLAAGCSKTPSQSSATPRALPNTWGIKVMNRPGTVFHVEYSDQTNVIDRQTVAKELRGFSDDHSIFFFQDSPEMRQKMAPGKIVLMEGLDLRKVDALAVDGSTLIVGTQTAPLREALKNAQVQWSAPVNFSDLYNPLAGRHNDPENLPSFFAKLDLLSRLRSELEPTVYASNPDELDGEKEIEGSDSSTWKFKYHHQFNADHSLGIDVQLTREAPGLDAEIEAKGNLSEFTQTASILMSDGQFKAASYQNVGLHGDVNFNWDISTSETKTPMNEVRISLPGKIEVPLEFTELPMSMEISEALLFHPAFTTKGEVAKGSFHVTYSGDEGLKLAGSDMETEGNAQGDSAIDSTVAFSPLASFGLVVAMAVPRVELKMGTEEIYKSLGISESTVQKAEKLLQNSPLVGNWAPKAPNPLSAEATAFFQVVISTTAATSGALSLVPCKQFTILAKGQVGVSADVLGVSVPEATKDVFSKGIITTEPNNKICGGAATQQ
jgi:hypothetical protein